MTQISDAKKGILTDEMKHVAKIEGVSEDFILKSVAKGTIVIPSNVTTIGNGAFYDCSNIQSVELTNHVTLIRENALYGCSSLASIKMSNSMQ